jgi:hypothetical protein
MSDQRNKFKKQKERERRVRRKILLRRKSIRADARETKKRELLEHAANKADKIAAVKALEKVASPELTTALEKVTSE